MRLGLIDAHYWNEIRDDNPHHHQEIQFGRHVNFSLEGMLAVAEIEVKRINVDLGRPQSGETAMQMKARACKGCDVALENHFNFIPDRSRDGFLVEVGAGDPVSSLMGQTLARHLARAAEVRCPVVSVPDPNYVTHRLFDICPVPFVLVELGNLHKPSLLQSYLDKGEFYFTVVRSLLAGLMEFKEVFDA